MSVDKVILRAFLSTLAAIALLFVFLFVSLIGFFPSTMMEITYDLGMEESSIKYAERAYERGADIHFIAHATTVAIELRDYEKIDACGETFVTHDGFTAYSSEIRENEEDAASYRRYIQSQVCVAKYKRGDKSAAVARAFEWNGNSFSAGNAVLAVLFAANDDGDTATVERVRTEMVALQERLTEEAERAYLEKLLGLLESA